MHGERHVMRGFLRVLNAAICADARLDVVELSSQKGRTSGGYPQEVPCSAKQPPPRLHVRWMWLTWSQAKEEILVWHEKPCYHYQSACFSPWSARKPEALCQAFDVTAV